MPWCMGDFNVVMSEVEKIDNSVDHFAVMEFSTFIQELGLIDLPLTVENFTWSNNRAIPIHCQLDHFLLHSEFIMKLPGLSHKLWPKSLSDHNPVSLEVKLRNWGLKPFCFYNYWMDLVGYQEMAYRQWNKIQSDWGNSPNSWVKLKDIKLAIKAW
ncbi:hypothetical protein DITRI_Ditri17bG0058400 [Diplodiscus trichospermus]